MKFIKYIFKFIFISVFSVVFLFAKPDKTDTLAIAKLEKILLKSTNVLQFDLSLSRNNEKWKYFANSTFQISFPKTDNVDYSKLKIEYVDFTSDLLKDYSSAPKYQILAKPLDDRLSIIIIGPDKIEDSKLIKSFEKIRLGRFTITQTENKPLSEQIFFTQPFDYYQACAFKYEAGGVVPDNVLEADENDNFEMFNKDYSEIVYQSEAGSGWITELNSFEVKYEGVLKVRLQFQTKSEFKTSGFFITRGLKVLPDKDLESLPDAMFTDTVADYRQPQFSEILKGQFSYEYGKLYDPVYDLVPYRNVEFCYRLFYVDAYGITHKLATRLLPIPNSVITAAQANPNPFIDKTEIEYKLDDDVILTIVAHDLIGNEIAKLTDEAGAIVNNVEKKTGIHKTFLSVDDNLAQGTYEVIFIAHPIKDPSVELSRAFVTVRRVRH